MHNLCFITCFFCRHYHVERVIRCFLNQDIKEPITLLLYNNSKIAQQLDTFEIPDNRNIILINNFLDLETGREYTNTGDIFRDALTYIPKECTIVSFMDSDDIFLPNHASEGMRRMKAAYKHNQLAYKPYFSYFLFGKNQIEKAHNNMEPSIFVDRNYVEKEGFHSVSASYHQKWLDKLISTGQLYCPFWGTPTFIYCWEDGHNTHKISGAGDNVDNFLSHRLKEVEDGDGILSPAKMEIVQKYYDLIKNQ